MSLVTSMSAIYPTDSDRQTDIQTYRQRHTDIETDRHYNTASAVQTMSSRWQHSHCDVTMSLVTSVSAIYPTDSDRQTDIQTDRQTDRQTLQYS